MFWVLGMFVWDFLGIDDDARYRRMGGAETNLHHCAPIQTTTVVDRCGDLSQAGLAAKG